MSLQTQRDMNPPFQEGDTVWIETFLPDPVTLLKGQIWHDGTTYRFRGSVATRTDQIVEIEDPRHVHLVKASPFDIAHWRKYKNAPEEIRLQFVPF